MPAPDVTFAALLETVLPMEQIAPFLPAPSELAKVDCRSTSAPMTLGDALAMALSLIPKAPDLDLVALSMPGRLTAAVAHHMTVAVLAATIQHRQNSG